VTDGGRPPLIILAHRLLIGAAIAFGIFYTAWEALAFRRTQAWSHLVVAALAAAVTAALAYYLKNLRRFVGHR
jgi:hypothetical protein